MNYLNKNGLSTLINKIKASLNAKANSSDIPTKFSQLTNDAGYLTSIPTASDSVLGGVKVGAGLAMNNGVLSVSNSLKGKKITVLGDSISAGAGANSNWVAILGTNTGAIVTNLAVGGATLANNNTTNNLITQMYSIPNDSDIVVVMAGGNDYYQSIPIGINDNYSDTTLKGALINIITYCQTNLPNAKLFVSTDTVIPSDDTVYNYWNAMSEICALYHTPFFNLFNNFGLNPDIESVRKIYYLEDYTHLTDEGQVYLADKMQKFIENETINNNQNATSLNGYKLSILSATEYSALTTKDANTIYITKDQKAYLGDTLILGGGTTGDSGETETTINLFDTANFKEAVGATSYEILSTNSFMGATETANAFMTFSVNVEANTNYNISFDAENSNTANSNYFVVTDQTDQWNDSAQAIYSTSGTINSGENTKIHIRFALSIDAAATNTCTFTNVKVEKAS